MIEPLCTSSVVRADVELRHLTAHARQTLYRPASGLMVDHQIAEPVEPVKPATGDRHQLGQVVEFASLSDVLDLRLACGEDHGRRCRRAWCLTRDDAERRDAVCKSRH